MQYPQYTLQTISYWNAAYWMKKKNVECTWQSHGLIQLLGLAFRLKGGEANENLIGEQWWEYLSVTKLFHELLCMKKNVPVQFWKWEDKPN